MQSLLIEHVLPELVTAADDGASVLLSTKSPLLLKKFQQDVLTFLYSLLAKIHPQPAAHHVHLGVHHFAVGPDDVRSQNEEREAKRIALALVDMLLCVSLTAIGVDSIYAGIEDGTQHKACQCAEWSGGDQTQEATNPFT